MSIYGYKQSGQFDWMLKTLLDIYEYHPTEDISVTAVAVFGLLKASAILKCVSVHALYFLCASLHNS